MKKYNMFLFLMLFGPLAYGYEFHPDYITCMRVNREKVDHLSSEGGYVDINTNILPPDLSNPMRIHTTFHYYAAPGIMIEFAQCSSILPTPDSGPGSSSSSSAKGGSPSSSGASGGGSGGSGGSGFGGMAGAGGGGGLGGGPGGPGSNEDDGGGCGFSAAGSIIDFANATVDEQIPIDGAPFYLNYSSYNKSRARLIDVNKAMGANTPQFSKIKVTLPNTQTFEISQPFSTYKDLWNMVDGNSSQNIFVSKASYEVSFVETVELPHIETFADMPLAVFNQQLLVYHPEVWGLSGWTLSNHHYFDHDSRTLFRGSGARENYDKTREVHIITLDDNSTAYLLPDRMNPEQYFVFGMDGRHLETRQVLTNRAIFKFSYDSNYVLTSVEDLHGKVTQFIYNGTGQLQKIIAPYGQESLFTVQNGLITAVTNSLQHSHQMTYDEATGLMISFTDLSGVVTSFSYNSFSELLAETKNTGFFQNLITVIENGYKVFKLERPWGVAQEAQFSANSTSEEVRRKDSTGSTLKSESYNIDTSGNLTDMRVDYGQNSVSTVKDPHPLFWYNLPIDSVKTISFNENGGTTQEKQYNIMQYSYVGGNPLNLSSVVQTNSFDGSSETERVITDVSARSIWHRSPLNHDTYSYFNETGQITRVEPPFQVAQDFIYNEHGQLIRTEKGTESEDYTYDTYGFLSQITNSKNQITSFVRDAQGKVLTQTAPNGEQTKYEYTAAGEIKKITTPSNQVHYFQMGIGDFLQQYLTPGNHQTSYVYDTSHRLTSVTRPSGREIEYGYSALTGRLETVQVAGGNYSYEYDTRQRMTAVTSSDGVRLEHAWLGSLIKTQTWYDTDNSLLATIEYNYEPTRLRASQILLNGTEIASMSYLNGLLRTLNAVTYYPNQTADYFQLEARQGDFSVFQQNGKDPSTGEPIQTIWGVGKEGEQELMRIFLNRSYDQFGQARSASRLKINTNTEMLESYAELKPVYDANDRLVQVEKSRRNLVNNEEVTSVEHYNQYDFPLGSNNNLKEFRHRADLNAAPNKRTVATHSDDDRLLTLRGSVNRDYTYTADGDLETMTNCYGETRYEYDVFSNLKKVILPTGQVIEYKVDGLNRRVKKLINGTVAEYYLWYDQTRIAAVLDANKQTKLVYLYGPDSVHSPSYVIKNGVSYRILHDPGLGSIRYVINPATREIMQEIEYDEYGNMMKNTDATFQPLTYAGGLYDADTKLIRFGARDYDPTVGRWTTKDPIGFAGGDTNLYGYVGQNPMSYNDPSGLMAPAVPLILPLVPPAVEMIGGAIISIGIGIGINEGFKNVCEKQEGEKNNCMAIYKADHAKCSSLRIAAPDEVQRKCWQSLGVRNSQCKQGLPLSPLETGGF